MTVSTSPLTFPRRADSDRQVRYGVRAAGVTKCPLHDIDRLRKSLGPPGQPPFPPAFLKASDEQTVVAIAALLQAIERWKLQDEDFVDWAVIAAPRFLGRREAADMLYKIDRDGSRKASPLFVPHRSLHAVSGTISQALKIHGPNFGVGGDAAAVIDGLTSSLALVHDYHPPGVWTVLTQCDPEPKPDDTGQNTTDVVCYAIALAFTPVADDWRGLRLSLCESGKRREPAAEGKSAADSAFAALYRYLETGCSKGRFGAWSCELSWGPQLRLSDE